MKKQDFNVLKYVKQLICLSDLKGPPKAQIMSMFSNNNLS